MALTCLEATRTTPPPIVDVRCAEENEDRNLGVEEDGLEKEQSRETMDCGRQSEMIHDSTSDCELQPKRQIMRCVCGEIMAGCHISSRLCTKFETVPSFMTRIVLFMVFSTTLRITRVHFVDHAYPRLPSPKTLAHG